MPSVFSRTLQAVLLHHTVVPRHKALNPVSMQPHPRSERLTLKARQIGQILPD